MYPGSPTSSSKQLLIIWDVSGSTSQICPPSKAQLSTFRLHFPFPAEKITYLMRIYDVLLAIDQSPAWLSLSEQITQSVCFHGGEKWSISFHINKQGCHSHQLFQSSECESLSPVGAQEKPHLRSGWHHSYLSKELWTWKTKLQDAGPRQLRCIRNEGFPRPGFCIFTGTEQCGLP